MVKSMMLSFHRCPFFFPLLTLGTTLCSLTNAGVIFREWMRGGVGEVISPLSLSYSAIVGRSKWYLSRASGYVTWLRRTLECSMKASPLMHGRSLVHIFRGEFKGFEQLKETLLLHRLYGCFKAGERCANSNIHGRYHPLTAVSLGLLFLYYQLLLIYWPKRVKREFWISVFLIPWIIHK